jgi:integrase
VLGTLLSRLKVCVALPGQGLSDEQYHHPPPSCRRGGRARKSPLRTATLAVPAGELAGPSAVDILLAAGRDPRESMSAPQLRQMQISELATWLQTRTNRNRRDLRSVATYLRIRRSHRQASASPALWLGTRNRGPLTGSGLYRMLKRRAEQAGYEPDVHPRQFRHTFATDWLADVCHGGHCVQQDCTARMLNSA